MIQPRCNFIISSFPNSKEKQDHLLSNIKGIKKQGGYVTLITHFDCDAELKNAVDFYLYNDKNEVSFKDSDVLNPDLIEITKNFSSLNWVSVKEGDRNVMYRNYKGWIGYTPSIVSLFLPALGMAFSACFDYVIYMESDFLFPYGFDVKVNSICSQIENENKDSLFYRVPDTGWVHGHLFFIKLTEEVYSRIPWGDYSAKDKFLLEFPNFIFEDFLSLISNRINPILKVRSDLDDFFGGGLGEKWDIHKFQWSMSDYMLYTTSVCSPFIDNSGNQKNRLFVHLEDTSPFDHAKFSVRISSDKVLLERTYTLNRGGWAWDSLDFLEPNGKYLFECSILHEDISISDAYEIRGDQLEKFRKFRNFEYFE